MAVKLFHGKAKWCKVRPGTHDELSESWTVNLYLDDESWELFHSAELQLKEREDEDGKFVTFRRRIREMDYRTNEEKDNEPPKVYLKDAQTGEYNAWDDGLIGNGSDISVAVEVYKSKKTKNVGHRMLRVFINDLVEYEGGDVAVAPDTAETPF